LQFLSEEEPEKEPEPEEADAQPGMQAQGEPVSPLDLNAPVGGGVHAVLDQVARPGAMVSGRVTFSDGQVAQWLIDEMGRPSIDPETPGYQPTEEDLMSFQAELGKLLQGSGL